MAGKHSEDLINVLHELQELEAASVDHAERMLHSQARSRAAIHCEDWPAAVIQPWRNQVLPTLWPKLSPGHQLLVSNYAKHRFPSSARVVNGSDGDV